MSYMEIWRQLLGCTWISYMDEDMIARIAWLNVNIIYGWRYDSNNCLVVRECHIWRYDSNCLVALGVNVSHIWSSNSNSNNNGNGSVNDLQSVLGSGMEDNSLTGRIYKVVKGNSDSSGCSFDSSVRNLAGTNINDIRFGFDYIFGLLFALLACFMYCACKYM